MSKKRGKSRSPVRLGRVNTIGLCRTAMLRVTKAMLSGKLDVKLANAAIFALTNVGRLLEVEMLEARLANLEAANEPAAYVPRERERSALTYDA
jgi:hypothetical protein